MKKSLLLSLAILAFYLPANAQLSFGIKGSITQSWFNDEPSDAPKMNGLGTTLLLYKRINKHFDIGIEPGMVQRGTEQQFDRGIYNPYLCICCFGDCLVPEAYPYGKSNGLRTSYVQAPILARANLPIAKGKIALFGKFGGGLSWLASGYYNTQVYDESSFGVKPEVKELDFSEEDSLKRWDWGLYSGAGFGFNLGCGMLTFEAEFYHGLRDMADYASFRNRSTSYSVGYLISL